MSDNERKTWIMLKKADQNKYIHFDSNVIPQFTSSTAVDDYGTWTCSGSGMKSGSAYKTLDLSTKTFIRSLGSTVTNRYMRVQLNLPENVEICAEEFEFYGKDWGSDFVMYFEGYNIETNAWETITALTTITTNISTIKMPATVTKYYNKFRWSNYNRSYSSREVYTDCYELRITKGTL